LQNQRKSKTPCWKWSLGAARWRHWQSCAGRGKVREPAANALLVFYQKTKKNLAAWHGDIN
jgi:hypothetical protein